MGVKCKKFGCTKSALYKDPDNSENPKYCKEHKPDNYVPCFNKPMCTELNCKTEASYGLKTDKKATRCKKHLLENYVNIVSARCSHPDCGERAYYGTVPVKGEKIKRGDKKLYCLKHKEPSHIDVTSAKCITIDCNKFAIYGDVGKHKKLYCGEHKPEGALNGLVKYCIHEKCKTQATYGDPNTGIVEFCAKHKQATHSDLKHRKCKAVNCNVSAYFGELNTDKPLYCEKHKLDHHVNVLSKNCEFIGCDTRPIYGDPKTNKARFCEKHKLEGFVNVRDKPCKYEGCTTLPVYGDPKIRKAEYCSTHRPTNYIDVKNKMCIVEKCKLQATFNEKGSSVPLYCSKHRHVDHENVKTRKCTEEKCEAQASFGFLFQDKSKCSKHKNPNMFRSNKPTCTQCGEFAYYAKEGSNFPIYCENHKTEDCNNLVEKPCLKCGLSYLLGPSSLCDYCMVVKPQVTHKKELAIKKFLDDNKIVYESHDKIIDVQCNKKRPDFVIDTLTFKIIVEVDENQHSSYSTECEEIRMKDIFQSFGGTHVLFIRYNPDEFKINGILQNVGSKQRKSVLLNLINYYMKQFGLPYPICKIYLFYDNYDPNYTPINVEYKIGN